MVFAFAGIPNIRLCIQEQEMRSQYFVSIYILLNIPLMIFMYTRSGERLFIPNNILQHMPALFVDGEVWCGRGMFPETQKIIYSLLSLIDWASFRYFTLLYSFDFC